MIKINWKPDKAAELPVYKQIVAYFSRQIVRQHWAPGSRLPSQRSLAEQLGVNRSTVVTAMEELQADGYIRTAGKGGTRIAQLDQYQPRPAVNWQEYAQASVHYPNQKIIRRINELDFSEDLIRLSSGAIMKEVHDIMGMGDCMVQAAQELDDLGYLEPKGLPALRREIARYLNERDIAVEDHEVLIVSGALQAIQLIALGLMQRGSIALLEQPSYLHSLNILKSLDMRSISVPTDRWGVRPQGLKATRPRNAHAMLYTIPNYHNPTGRVVPENRRQAILRTCQEERIPIVEDDVYRELWYDLPPPRALKSMDRTGQVLYVGSISKFLSPGLRVGWIVGPQSVIDHLADIKMQVDYGTSSLAQQAAAHWFARLDREERLEAIRSALKVRRDHMQEALTMYMADLAQWEVPVGGFYFWVRLNEPISSEALFEEAVENGVLLYPGQVYGDKSGTYLRLSFSYESPDRLAEGVRRLSEIIRGGSVSAPR